MSLPRYPAYKNSGVEWLGEVPEHWHVDRLKASIVSCKNGIWGDEPAGEGADIACVRVADFDRSKLLVKADIPTMRSISERERDGRILSNGNLLLEKSGGGEKQPVGQVVIYELNAPAVCSNFVARIVLAEDMWPRYWMYVHAAAYSSGVNKPSIKQTSGIQNLDQSQYFDERGPFPELVEQRGIADFLDAETRKIDVLIAEQEGLLALLTEKRQATISHAVTRGIDRDIQMKESGIPWLGKIPAHWGLLRIGTLYREIVESGSDALPVLSVSIHAGVSDRELDDAEVDRKVARSEDKSKYKAVLPGDLVYNMMRAWQGGFGTVKVPGQVSPAYVVARPAPRVMTGYMEQVLRTPGGTEEVRRYSRGITEFRLRLYWDEFKAIVVPVPPLDEQNGILRELDEIVSRFEKLARETDAMIELLKERRNVLISDAVTGKVDVRSAL